MSKERHVITNPDKVCGHHINNAGTEDINRPLTRTHRAPTRDEIIIAKLRAKKARKDFILGKKLPSLPKKTSAAHAELTAEQRTLIESYLSDDLVAEPQKKDSEPGMEWIPGTAIESTDLEPEAAFGCITDRELEDEVTQKRDAGKVRIISDVPFLPKKATTASGSIDTKESVVVKPGTFICKTPRRATKKTRDRLAKVGEAIRKVRTVEEPSLKETIMAADIADRMRANKDKQERRKKISEMLAAAPYELKAQMVLAFDMMENKNKTK